MSNPINSACVANALGIQPDQFATEVRIALVKAGKLPAPLTPDYEYFDIVAVAALVGSAPAIRAAAQSVVTAHRTGAKVVL